MESGARPARVETPTIKEHLILPSIITLLGLQSLFGDNWEQITWNLRGLSPKRDWNSKRVYVTLSLNEAHVGYCILVGRNVALAAQHNYSIQLSWRSPKC